jgi:protein import protein ZIM17
LPCASPSHLIADHIGWFNESTQNGMFKTVEDLLRAKGELVQRGNVYDDGTIEILPEPEKDDEREAEP